MPNTKIPLVKWSEVDIIEESNTTPQNTIEELEVEFNAFIKEMEAANDTVSSKIQMDELNEIGDEVIKAKQYLTSFANGEKKSIREQAYSQLTALPLIGTWAKDKVEEVQVQHMKDSGVKEVLEGIFESFETKKKRLVELTIMAEGMRDNLIEQEKQLGEYIRKLDEIIANPPSVADKMRALDMSIIAQSQDRISKEMIYNQINFIIELMENLMIKISKTLPTLKNTLSNSLNIVGTINSIKDAVEMMNTLEDLSNEITKTSTNNIQNLIVDVTKSLSDGTDIEFYRESAKRNEDFNKTLTQARVKHIETTVSNYETLKQIEVDTSNQIEMRRKAEAKALGMSIEALKDASEVIDVIGDE
jgi:hypothetical protein